MSKLMTTDNVIKQYKIIPLKKNQDFVLIEIEVDDKIFLLPIKKGDLVATKETQNQIDKNNDDITKLYI